MDQDGPREKRKSNPRKGQSFLEEIAVPNNAEHKRAALDFVSKTLKESGNEVICTGSSISVRKESGGEIVCITGYVYVKEGFTLNNALVRQGLATTTNPLYKSWQQQAKEKKLGMWRRPRVAGETDCRQGSGFTLATIDSQTGAMRPGLPC